MHRVWSCHCRLRPPRPAWLVWVHPGCSWHAAWHHAAAKQPPTAPLAAPSSPICSSMLRAAGCCGPNDASYQELGPRSIRSTTCASKARASVGYGARAWELQLPPALPERSGWARGAMCSLPSVPRGTYRENRGLRDGTPSRAAPPREAGVRRPPPVVRHLRAAPVQAISLSTHGRPWATRVAGARVRHPRKRASGIPRHFFPQRSGNMQARAAAAKPQKSS